MKIFLAGAVSFAYETQIKKYEIYEKILKSKFKNLNLVTPNDIWKFREDLKESIDNEIELNKKMVDFDLQELKSSDLVVCDLSELSTGLGLELGVALESHKKIVFFFEKGAYISNMITGAFSTSKFVIYENLNDLEKLLKEIKL